MARTTFDVEIGPADAQLRRLVDQLGAEAPKAATRALTKVMGTVQTAVIRAMAAKTGLLSSRIRKSVRLRKPTFENLLAVLSVSGKPISLLAFGARQTRTGVTVSGGRGAGRTAIPHGFIAEMRNKRRGVFLREGKARLPIHKQYGPALPAVAEPILAAERQGLEAKLRTQFESEARFILTGSRTAPAGDGS